MFLHYYILHHIAREINALAGMFLTECFTQERNTLHCVFESGRETRTLEIQLDSRAGAIFLRPEFHRARKNTVDIFPELIGRTLQSASVLQDERVIVLSLPPYTLHCIVFAGWNAAAERSSANALVTVHDQHHPSEQRIIAAFRSPQDLAGKVFHFNTVSPPTPQEIIPETSLEEVIEGNGLLLGSFYTQEVMRRLYKEQPQRTALSARLTATPENIQSAKRIAEAIRHECLETREFFLLRGTDNKLLISLLRPTNVASPKDETYTIERTFSSASEAVRFSLATAHREARFHTLWTKAEAQCKKMLAKAERALRAIEQDTEGAKRAQERQLWAEILLSQPNFQQKGLNEIELEDWSGEPLTIRLQPALSLRENAEEYFQKASAARATLKKREQRRKQQQTIIQHNTQALERLRNVHSEQELEQWMASHGQSNKSASLLGTDRSSQQNSDNRKTARFREFPLSNDYTLYVGKTAADNDELTLRFAKPNDYWFHARGVPGSHAVLRGSSKDKKPPKDILEQAASIAAYFSKARNAKLSPVAYTQKKYVRKPKGAAVGAVIIEREEVVMVRPNLPAGSLASDTDET